jgi:integrase
MADVPKILRELNKSNYKKKIKLRYKKLKFGYYSLYFDMWHKGKRSYKILKIYIKGTKDSLIDDDKKIRIAISMRDKMEMEIIQNEAGFKLNSIKAKADFVEFFKNYSSTKKSSSDSWSSTCKHLIDFTRESIRIADIDTKFCEDFKDYLLSNVSHNSANQYYTVFKAAIKQLLKNDIITKDPSKDITIPKEETEREFLTEHEIKILSETPADDNNVKNAFLFSCFTGLRISDIMSLGFDNIQEGYLNFRQAKTKSTQRIKLSETALDIIKEQREQSDQGKIFKLKTYPTIVRQLKKWIDKTDISKHITFHSSRHTFATLCLTYDVDLYTVSKLLGHKDIGATQIYAKLIDKKRDEAVDKLPRI